MRARDVSPDHQPAAADDSTTGWRVFEDARLLWVWFSRPLNFEDPTSPISSTIAAALRSFDYSGYGLCLDLRQATFTGQEDLDHARTSAMPLRGFDLSGMNVAVLGEQRTIERTTIRRIVVGAWVDAETRAFTDIVAALTWLGVSDKVSPADLVVPAH